MNEFLLLIGQILFIVLLQTVIEAFVPEDKKQQRNFLNIACILGSLYFLMQFAFQYIMREINTVVKFPF